MEREKRTSRESMSTDETVDIDFELNNLSIILPEEVINMIIRSTILSHNIKNLVYRIFWLISTNNIEESVAEDYMKQLLFPDAEVYIRFLNYIEQYRLFDECLCIVD